MDKLFLDSNDTKIIFNPSIDDLISLRIKFEENFDELILCVQILGLHDDNSYDSFIFFKNEDKTYFFKEYEDPQHMSFSSSVVESSYSEFIDNLIKNYDPERFIKNSLIFENFNKLNKELENNKKTNKNHTIKI